MNSTTQMSAKTVSNTTASVIAATIIVRTVDSKGNVVSPGGNRDQSKKNSKESPVANATSGSGNKFTSVYIVCSAMYNNDDNQVAIVDYKYEP